MKETPKKNTYNKPITLHPLTFREALEGLLKTKPMPKEKKSDQKRTKKKDDK